MKILLLGSGGREHAFAWKLLQSNKCSSLYVSPGNAGTSLIATNITLPDFTAIKDFCLSEHIELVIVGPEQPLVDGIYDFFIADDAIKHIPVIGPSKQGARLEGSKAFCKSFLVRHQIPTAQYKEVTVDTLTEGLSFLDSLTAPYVLKADGLAAGKGVIIVHNLEEAKHELKQLLNGKFGVASQKVVIEEFMHGIEFSVFVLTDGTSYKILPVAKDYKRIGEGDTGLNTGGMGAISPPSFVTDAIMQTVDTTIIQPTLKGLVKDKIIYKGFIYIGIMLTPNNIPKVVEYNCRMGDPETQAVLPRLKNDMVDLFLAVANNTLETITIDIDDKSCVCIVLAAEGYPEIFEKGKEIKNLELVEKAWVFHAGTTYNEQGAIVSNGGRVLAVAALGLNYQEALAIANKNATTISYANKYFRKDIGFDM